MNQEFPKNWQVLLAKNIQVERKRLGLTQFELAEKIGLGSDAVVTTWEKGKGFPRFSAFIELCIIFDRFPNDLICEDLSEKPPDGKIKPLPTEGVSQTDEGRATESPPPKQEDLKAMKRQMLEFMMKLEELES